jgi:hypothetical protein
VYNQFVISEEIVTESIEVIVGTLNLASRGIVKTEVLKPGLDNVLSDVEVLAKLERSRNCKAELTLDEFSPSPRIVGFHPPQGL